MMIMNEPPSNSYVSDSLGSSTIWNSFTIQGQVISRLSVAAFKELK